MMFPHVHIIYVCVTYKRVKVMLRIKECMTHKRVKVYFIYKSESHVMT